MKTSGVFGKLIIAGIALGLSCSALASNRHHVTYAQVVDARPVYQRVAHQVPSEYCHIETVTYRDSRRDSHTGTIVGGLIGAALGHELGHSKRNKDVGAVAGGLLGASIGRDLSRNSGSTVRYRDQQVCHTRYHTEYREQLLGYDVTYRYQGRLYQTHTQQHPGSRIPVDVQVRPVHAYRQR